MTGVELGEDDEDYTNLIDVAREKLKRPWSIDGLDAATVKTALGSKSEKASNALTLSDQIGPVLASGTNGNPRQIKRFLNTLLLRERTAVARGFGDDIKLPVLAKLMLAERFIPRLFEQLAYGAAVHPEGLSEDLELLEKELTSIPRKPVKTMGEEPKSSELLSVSDSVVLAEWKGSEAVCDWGRLMPELSGIDLRPYLFVTKDKKDYFGPVSALGHLAGVVERLFSGKMAVQALEQELGQLVQPEAEKVFEAVRTKVVSSGAFDIKPAGVDGLVVLVKAQPELQSHLLDFLETLPHSKCGPWIVSGWQGVIKNSDSKGRLKQLLTDLSKLTTNSLLKAAAEAALKQPRGGR